MSDATNVVAGCPECGAVPSDPAARRDESAIVAACREVMEMDLADPVQRGEAYEMIATALASIDDR